MDAWMTACPLQVRFQDDSPALPVAVGEKVRLDALPVWLQSGRVLDTIREQYGTQTADFAQLALITEYNAESLGDPVEEGSSTSKQDRALDLVSLANLALWLARPAPIGFELAVHAELHDDEWALRKMFRTSRLLPLAVNEREKLSGDDLGSACTLANALTDLSRNGRVWMSIRYLWQALKQEWWEGRYALLWTVLETLFGPDSPGETTYRLSQRVALFLAQTKDEAGLLMRDLKKGYSWRSKVVHGASLDKLQPELSIDIMANLEGAVRESMLRILVDHSLIDLFDGSNRDECLDDLVLSWGSTV